MNNTKCRLCHSKVKKFLDLGKTPLPEEFRSKSELYKKVIKYPLNLVFCLSCGHVQLGYKVEVKTIYKENYFYDYSVTKTGNKHWQKYAEEMVSQYKLSSKYLVVDIGSNTGVLLENFKALGVQVLGVDPSTKHVKIANSQGVTTIDGFFSPLIARKIVRQYGQAKIITCNNTFDHVDDLEQFMEGINILLKKDGVFVFEVPYFLIMVSDLTHTVYHQQIDYIMLAPFVGFFRKYGLEIGDVKKIPLHGGSIRVYLHTQGIQNKNIELLLKDEEKVLKNWPEKLENFALRIYKQRNEFIKMVDQLKSQGYKIAGVGASAKGINLLNYSGLNSKKIEFITEKSYLKIGKFTPSKIPIVSDEELITKKIDFLILLSWNFKKEILSNLRYVGIKKLKYIIPVPKITTI